MKIVDFINLKQPYRLEQNKWLEEVDHPPSKLYTLEN